MRKKRRSTLELANGPYPKSEPQLDEKPILYLSHSMVHTRELEEEFLNATGVRYRCCSFVYLEPRAIYWTPRAWEGYLLNVERGNHIMMDSGAFSFQMFVFKHKEVVKNIAKMRQQTVEWYVEFCKKRSKDWDFYVTFDYERNCQTIWDMTKKLEEYGLKPAPVYHADRSLDWLKKYLDAGYRRIGISPLLQIRSSYRNVRNCLDGIFRTIEPYKNVKLHGFAMTSLSLMFGYPWYSVDSSSWSRTASYGSIYAVDPYSNRLSSLHVSLDKGEYTQKSVSSLSAEALKSVREQVEGNGFDFDLMRKSVTYRHIYCGWTFAHLIQFRESNCG